MPDLRLILQNFGQRRAFALIEPRQQLRLAVTMLSITSLFVVLALANSYTAFAPMLRNAMMAAPEVWAEDLTAQTGLYVIVSVALAGLYAAAMVGASIAFVGRMVGPLVAIRRHVRALKLGRYSSRIRLRAGAALYGEMAEQLNELAAALEKGEPPPLADEEDEVAA